MPIARFEMPDGRVARFEVPDGTTPEQAQSLIEQSLGQQPTVVKAGQELNSIPRQLGLTARYGIEALANNAQIVTEPLRYLTDIFVPDRQLTLSDLVTGQKAPPKSLPLGVIASNFADYLGLPKPETANERVIGDASRLVAGAGGLGGVARTASAAPGLLGKAGEFLSRNMGSQLASAAGAGLAGGASREAGGSPLEQGVSAFLGGMASGFTPGLFSGAVDKARNAFNRLTPQDLDLRISALLQGQGIDYSALPAAARNSLRQDLQSALQAGQELNPEAVRRLADFRTIGAAPTRGMVTQNPVQITREQNLAKTGANSADEGLQGLALLQNRNNATFIDNLNRQGAGQGNAFNAGASSINAIDAQDARLGRQVSDLYTQARNMAGGDIPLDRKPFIDNIFNALNRENKLAFLPDNIGKLLNEISQNRRSLGMHGPSVEVPFDVSTIDNLKTMLATAQRGTGDGNVRAALTIARRALDETPVVPIKNTFGGNQVVTDAGANFLRTQDAQAGNLLDALNRARQASAQRFGWQESARPIEAALGGAQPDNFIKRFVIGGSLADAEAISNTAPVEPIKNAILAHLKEKALNGASDEVGKFSQSAYNKALREIGDRKLSLFFSPEEVGQLQALGRVASYAQVQPVGSAVNNSNSGALLLGKGLDALSGLAKSAPFVGPLVAQPVANGINGLNVAIRTRQAQNVVPGLLASAPNDPAGASLLLPALSYSGGLLSAP